MSDKKLYLISHHVLKDESGVGMQRRYYERYADFHKIGVATDPEQRLSNMQSGTPHRLKLITTVECDDAAEVEGHLHSIYSMTRRSGEWFRLTSKTINSLIGLDYLSEDTTKVLRTAAHTDPEWFDYGLYVAAHRVRSGEITLDGVCPECSR